MTLRAWAQDLNREVLAVWIAARDSRVPWYAKALALGIAAYALSPIDLIPDIFPVIGYLDDLLIVPAGIWLVIRLIPVGLMLEFRAEAKSRSQRPTSPVAAIVIISIWIVALAAAAWFCLQKLS